MARRGGAARRRLFLVEGNVGPAGDLVLPGYFPGCAELLFYDHVSGALVAVVKEKALGGDVCAGYVCVAGPPTFVVPDEPCTTVTSCGPQ